MDIVLYFGNYISIQASNKVSKTVDTVRVVRGTLRGSSLRASHQFKALIW